ncbi:MAG: arsenate reductase ArsC [Candidatus Omnitrophota bacterium]
MKILFVCVENSCRSQMAEAFCDHFSKGSIEAYSAGSKPSGKVNETAIELMKDAGLDISRAESKGFYELPIKEFDYVVSMGCKDTCPFVPAEKHIEWDIEDPKDKSMEVFMNVRDDIKESVRALIEDMII